jgi:hypothetical protein
VTATEPPKPPDFFQTAARAGLALIPGIGGAVQVIYEDVRANIAYRQWQTIQEIADNVGEAALAEQLDDDAVRQALFVNGVEVATRTGLENKRRLLAKVVSAAMLDDFKIDGAQFRVEALRDLDVPQIKALERLHRLAVEHAGREDDKSIAATYHEAVQAAWLAEPYPVRAALTRTGVAFAPRGTYGGFSSKASTNSAAVCWLSSTMLTRSIGKGRGSHRPIPVPASRQARSAHHGPVAGALRMSRC